MSENLEPFARIRTSETTYELNRDNTYLFTHLGRAAIYDHIWVEVGSGAVQWRYRPESGEESEQYKQLKPLVVDNECTLYLNLKEPAESDVELYLEHALPDWDNLESEGE